MAKDPKAVPTAVKSREPRPAAAVAAGGPPATIEKKRVGLAQFLREVRAEARKVTWTSWKETWITSVMVAIMVVLTAMFFWGVDLVLHLIIGSILKLANAE
jgi:preprotein translocase subunit SecE